MALLVKYSFLLNCPPTLQRFIAPDCPEPVLLSTETTHEIVQGICTDSGAVDERCFDAALAQIIKSLEAEYFRDFLRSECYAKYQVLSLCFEGFRAISYKLYPQHVIQFR